MYWPLEGIGIPWHGRAGSQILNLEETLLNIKKCSAQPGGPGSCAEYRTQ